MNEQIADILRQLQAEMRAEYESTITTFQRENALLKAFCLSLLTEAEHPQVALARLLSRCEDIEGFALFSEWSEAEVQSLLPTANALLEELRQRLPS
ncbi:hypothetical protein ACFO3A_01105 [Comamonas nitrativorans]|uniref:Uncharacterized protein n=1 Tax=Comamonas nitrativorans TaxID=108437 RepID=A0ABV9GRH4_9BURK